MVQDLITLPLRVAAFTTRVGVHLAVNALAVGFTVTERLIEVAMPRPEQSVGQGASWSVEVLAGPAEDPSVEPPAESASEPAVPEESLPDAGARNGAGASTQVSEPWAGYARMNAHEVIHHLTGATADEAAVVELYERSHRKRKTVLATAERRLRQPASVGRSS